MKTGVLGTGVVGQTISEKLSQMGHDVMIGTRNKEAALSRTGKDNFGRPPFSEWIKNNPQVKLGTFNETASYGEILVNAVNGNGTMQALESVSKENLVNKVLIDISNPLDFSKGMPPTLFLSNTDSLAEKIQRTWPSLKVVKSLNTMNAYVMVNPSAVPGDHNVFICGNDSGAKQKVKGILKSFGWKKNNIIDLGDITGARGAEMILPIWVRLMGVLKTPMFNFHIVTSP